MQTAFLKLVAADIQKRFGNDLSEIAIVFNNKRPITYLKKHLSEVYGQAIWSPQFFTIQEFLRLSTDDTEASPLTQFFHLFNIHNELLVAEGKLPEALEEFYPIAEIILSDFGQLDYDLVPIEQIYLELYDNTKIDIAFQHLTQEQQGFIRQFWQSFSIAGHSGVQERFLQLWKRLPVLYDRFKEKLKTEGQTNYPTVYRDLVEGKATHQQFASSFQRILFVGFNALNKAETKLFKQWQDEGRALFYFDADAYYLEDTMQEAGLFIRRNIFQTGLVNALGDSPNIIGNRTSTVNLYASTGKISQTKLLYDILERNNKMEQTSAILLADENLLVPLLQSLPEVKPNITTGYPLTQSPIYGILDLWLEVHLEISQFKKRKIPYQIIETFINHPLSMVSLADKLQIQKEIADKQLFEIALEELHIKSSLPQFFVPIDNSAYLIPSLILLVDDLLHSISSQERIRQIDNNLLIETKKTLNQLLLGFETVAPLSISFQIGLIKKAIAPINSAIEGDPLEGIQIMGLLESRCLNFDNVYILGANEGILPKTSNSPTFIPNSLRSAYGLPILENQDALSAYLFYRHFQYSEGIHIFYNGLVDESSTGEESRFIKQLEFESKFRFDRKIQQQTIQFADKAQEIVIEKRGEVWEKMYQNFIVNQKRISATALTTYLQSPLQFFLKHIAGIKEPPSISQEFEMNKLGTVIHNVMEKIFLPFKGQQDFTPTSVLQKQFDKVEAQVIREIGLQYQIELKATNDLNSLQRIMLKIAGEYVKMYLEYDINNYKAFRIIELENDNDYVLPFPIQINGEEQQVTLYGIIDRVDEVVTHDDRIISRIVDYKTGGDSIMFKGIDQVFAPNTENKAMVQTLFYAYVFEQKTGRKQLEPHLYVARKMREEGTLFSGKEGVLTDEFLAFQKENFVEFLRDTLQEIFNPAIPFRHNPDTVVYPSDPYTLFYREASKWADAEE
ncbi:PD-(D/E)XK nuclease family protein [Sphingobacterium multivorum]|uniref:Inactivated superfamily I helicase n=1 Tax=Sphingobacterium multivorum TaxID=28454 RepID=A0A2X2IYS4_SPHMU|nr:PD-(D/E)XK nuclease family protein [Sphingobacterium multivorum]QRQ60701.1 PD-(D/E)XK nuclease family protein [Sphingobacterium multivorum]SPZ87442.1 Inactivated superfamily I helicase [Sphingobacterium multivorum]